MCHGLFLGFLGARDFVLIAANMAASSDCRRPPQLWDLWGAFLGLAPKVGLQLDYLVHRPSDT